MRCVSRGKKLDIMIIYMREWKNWPIKKEGNLYYRGEWKDEIFKKTIVVVGSRKMTRYGKEVVNKIVPDLVANKFTVISGFMYGIDSEAHKICLENGGITVAVLGSGLNYLTTAENDDLYTRILESGGLVVSEFEPEFKATTWSFPMRNKVVVKMATEGILIVEAGLKSGSLITARLGRETGKQVWAVPGQINSPSSQGTNWLIKNNQAKMITEISDILPTAESCQEKLFEIGLSRDEQMIYELVKLEPLTVDEIARKLSKTISQVAGVITKMSMKNIIDEEMGKIYRR